MTAAFVFQLVNALVLPAWLSLVFFPKKKWRQLVVYTIALLMALVYAVYVVSGLGQFNPEAFSTLAGIKALFATDQAVLAGWIHYLVFDLLVGNWLLQQSQKHGISHAFMLPCLLLCFMFGPVGFIAYTLVRLAYKITAKPSTEAQQ